MGEILKPTQECSEGLGSKAIPIPFPPDSTQLQWRETNSSGCGTAEGGLRFALSFFLRELFISQIEFETSVDVTRRAQKWPRQVGYRIRENGHLLAFPKKA